MIEGKIAEIQAILDRKPDEEESTAAGNGTVASGPTDRCVVKFPDDRGEILVIIGTSEHIAVPGLVDRICRIVDAAYSSVGKHKYVDEEDAIDRLEMGDAGPQANRVLHLAFKGEQLVGCASSTFSPGWTPEGCGHWGLLAVDPAHQKSGIATALVLAAERRIATACEAVQIEYQHTEGDAFSHRLMEWYEGKLGFSGGPRSQRPGTTCFRRCRKRIPEDEQRKGYRRRLQEILSFLNSQLELVTKAEQEEAARGLGGAVQGEHVGYSVAA